MPSASAARPSSRPAGRPSPPPRVSIYDLDRTLTRHGTYLPFLLYAARRLAPWRLLRLPEVVGVMAAFKLGLASRDQLKEIMHARLLGERVSGARVRPVAEAFADRVVERGCHPEVVARLQGDLARGVTVVIATAANRLHAEPIARRLGVSELVATESAWEDGHVLARLGGPTRRGAAKLEALQAWFAAHPEVMTDGFTFYSDEHSDLPVFEHAAVCVAVHPGARLRRVADTKRWEVVTAPSAERPRFGARAVGLAIVALVTAVLASQRIWLIPAPVSFNANEGWNAFQALHAMGSGGPLYPPSGALTGDNYPPLSFLLVGGLMRLTGGDAIVIGRLLSVAGLLATAGAVALAVRRLEPERTWAPAAAALVVLAFAATQFRDYLAMDDPQWLAHAVMTPALVLLLPRRAEGSPDPTRVVLAAVLVVLGLLVKHNLAALPLAATAWLAWRHRRSFLPWSATGLALGALATAAIVSVYGSDAVRDVVAAPRQESWLRMARASLGPLLASAPLAVAAAGLLHLRRIDRRLELPLLFIAAAVPLGVLQRAGEGVNYNAHFEALIALAIGGGAVLAHARASGSPRRELRTAAWLVLPLLVLTPLAAAAAVKEAHAAPAERRAWVELERRIAAGGGHVACETPALCFWAGAPFVLDFFLYGQRVSATRDASALRTLIDEGDLTLVQRDPAHRLKPGDSRNPVDALLDARADVTFVAVDGRRLERLRR